MNQIVIESKKLQSDIVIVINANHKLEEEIVYPGKNNMAAI